MEQLVKVMELDDDMFDEKFELVKSKVKSLINDWRDRDYPKGRGIEVHVITKKPNHKDVWKEEYNFADDMKVFFTAEIGTKKPDIDLEE
jgi:hypothetical protein